MEWLEELCFRCSECKRLYEVKPKFCICQRSLFEKGERIGSFRVVGEGEKENNILVQCLLCGLSKEMHYTNVKRQQSCGCKPRHIEILSLNDKHLQYTCKKCGEVKIEAVPLIQYCCEEEQEDGVIEL